MPRELIHPVVTLSTLRSELATSAHNEEGGSKWQEYQTGMMLIDRVIMYLVNDQHVTGRPLFPRRPFDLSA